MSRVLIVANETVGADELLAEIRRLEDEKTSTYLVVVPAKPLHEGHGSVWTQEGAQEAAQARLDGTLAILHAGGPRRDGQHRRLVADQRDPRRAHRLRRRPHRHLHAPRGPLPLAAQGRGGEGARVRAAGHPHRLQRPGGRRRVDAAARSLAEAPAGNPCSMPRTGDSRLDRPAHPVTHDANHARPAPRAPELGPAAPATHAARPTGGGGARVRRAAGDPRAAGGARVGADGAPHLRRRPRLVRPPRDRGLRAHRRHGLLPRRPRPLLRLPPGRRRDLGPPRHRGRGRPAPAHPALEPHHHHGRARAARLAERIPAGGRLLELAGGAAWAAATYFVVPALALDDVGPIGAIRTSARTVRGRWARPRSARAASGSPPRSR